MNIKVIKHGQMYHLNYVFFKNKDSVQRRHLSAEYLEGQLHILGKRTLRKYLYMAKAAVVNDGDMTETDGLID